VIYTERRRVLEGADLHEQIRLMIDEVVASYVAGATSVGFPEEWDLDKLWRAFGQLFPIGISVDDMIEEAGDKAGLSADLITEVVMEQAHAAYDHREEELTSEVMRELERRVVLSVLDRKWREHLYEMDYLREGIGLRAMAQRDPLIEYQREGFDMFNAMMDGIKEESVGALFNLQVEVQENPITEEAPAGAGLPGVAGAAGPLIAAPQDGPAPAGASGRPAVSGGAPAGTRDGAGRHAGNAAETRGGNAAGGRRRAPAASGRAGAAGGNAPGASGRAGAAGGNAPAAPVPAGLTPPRRTGQLQYTAPSVDGGTHVEHHTEGAVGGDFERVGRNDPCPCGSGRKFKRCHGDPRNRAAN
jgi:preprotein translocase subunit SecA